MQTQLGKCISVFLYESPVSIQLLLVLEKQWVEFTLIIISEVTTITAKVIKEQTNKKPLVCGFSYVLLRVCQHINTTMKVCKRAHTIQIVCIRLTHGDDGGCKQNGMQKTQALEGRIIICQLQLDVFSFCRYKTQL